MIVGIDLDNTIVNCEAVFRQEAQKLLEQPLDHLTREQIRALIREKFGDPHWTYIQAEVYGPLYPTCPPFDGALDVLAEIAALPQVEKLLIISHKTERDSAGKQYALRDFAKAWLHRYLIPLGFLKESDIFFLETKQEKIDRILAEGCEVFFDDLPEIIEALGTKVAKPVLFSTQPHPHFLTGNWTSFKRQVIDG